MHSQQGRPVKGENLSLSEPGSEAFAWKVAFKARAVSFNTHLNKREVEGGFGRKGLMLDCSLETWIFRRWKNRRTRVMKTTKACPSFMSTGGEKREN